MSHTIRLDKNVFTTICRYLGPFHISYLCNTQRAVKQADLVYIALEVLKKFLKKVNSSKEGNSQLYKRIMSSAVAAQIEQRCLLCHHQNLAVAQWSLVLCCQCKSCEPLGQQRSSSGSSILGVKGLAGQQVWKRSRLCTQHLGIREVWEVLIVLQRTNAAILLDLHINGTIT